MAKPLWLLGGDLVDTMNMKFGALALISLTAIATSRSAYAEFWPDGPQSSYSFGRQYYGGPYYVRPAGEHNQTGQRRYWGGHYFISCPGFNPPYETYRPPYPACGARVKIAVRSHHRIRVRLK